MKASFLLSTILGVIAVNLVTAEIGNAPPADGPPAPKVFDAAEMPPIPEMPVRKNLASRKRSSCGTAYNEHNQSPLTLANTGRFEDTNRFRWAYLRIHGGCKIRVCTGYTGTGTCSDYGDDWNRHWMGWYWQNDVKSYLCYRC